MPVEIKRAYDKPSLADGQRVLVDGLWPRGIKKEKARIDHWLKRLAPSEGLRKWFHHDATRWSEFRRRYFAELDAKAKAIQPLFNAARGRRVTLLFSARDTEHNNAVALKAYLERKSAKTSH